MALNSINTNASAMAALANLSATQNSLQQTQNIISTGKKINSAKDNGAVWSIAQTMQGKVESLDSVKDSLNGPSPPSTWPCRPANRSPTC